MRGAMGESDRQLLAMMIAEFRAAQLRRQAKLGIAVSNGTDMGQRTGAIQAEPPPEKGN